MRKTNIQRLIFVFIVFIFCGFLLKSDVFAGPGDINKGCSNFEITDSNGNDDSQQLSKTATWIGVRFNVDNKNANYTIYTDDGRSWDARYSNYSGSTGEIGFTITKGAASDIGPFRQGSHSITIERVGAPDNPYCKFNYQILEPSPTPALQQVSCELSTVLSDTVDGKQFTPSTNLWVQGKVFIKNFQSPQISFNRKDIGVTNRDTRDTFYYAADNINNTKPVTDPTTTEIPFISYISQQYEGHIIVKTNQMVVSDIGPRHFSIPECKIEFDIKKDGTGGVPTPTPTSSPPTPSPSPTITPIPAVCLGSDARLAQATNDCSPPYKDTCFWCISPTPRTRPTSIPKPTLTALCDQLTDKEPLGGKNYRQQCKDCDAKGKLWTAFGCVPINYTGVIQDIFLKTGVGVAGGIAFIYFLYGAFIILTSSGNAEKMEEAKQIMTSSLAGLILIIFSVFLLQIIGVQILQLPDFK